MPAKGKRTHDNVGLALDVDEVSERSKKQKQRNPTGELVRAPDTDTRQGTAHLPKKHDDIRFSEYEKSIRESIARIKDCEGKLELDLKSDKIRTNLKAGRYKLRKRLKGETGKFLEQRSQNAANEHQKKAALNLLKDALEASELKRCRVRVVNADTMKMQLEIIESRTAEGLLSIAAVLEGSEEWSERKALREKWLYLTTRRVGAVKAYLQKNNGVSESEKEECKRRLDRCTQFSPWERRIMKECVKLALHLRANELSDGDRSTLLETEEEGETLQQAIEAVRMEWKDRFNPNLSSASKTKMKTKMKMNAHASDHDHDHDHEQRDGGSSIDVDANHEESIEDSEAESDLFANLDGDDECDFMGPVTEVGGWWSKEMTAEELLNVFC